MEGERRSGRCKLRDHFFQASYLKKERLVQVMCVGKERGDASVDQVLRRVDSTGPIKI